MKIGVIADDLTGANATGVKLSGQGLVSTTVFHNTPLSSSFNEDVICVDTDSRYAPKNVSSKRVINATLKLQNWGVNLLCKRIDSTVRGNIGCEIDAMLETVGDGTTAIILPSYPATGRVLVGGNLLVNNELVHETDIANDPIEPLKSSFVPAILDKQSIHQTALIDLSVITQGSEVIENKIKNLISKGIRLIICDAVSEKHIKAIAKAMSQIKYNKFIPVDPGPLTNYYVHFNNANREKCEAPKFLFTVGSATSVTSNQIQYLMEKEKIKPFIINPENLATMGSSWYQEVERAVREFQSEFITEEIILVTTNHPSHSLIDLKSKSKEEGVSIDVLAKRITEGLAEISKQIIILCKGKIKGCFFSGGDVTSSFCELANTDRIRLEGAVMPLVTHGQLMGGIFDGLSIVTKGGMVGNHKAMKVSYKYLNSLTEIKRRVSVD